MEKTKLPNIVAILIMTLITVIMWVGFSVYRAFTSEAPVTVPSTVSQKLTPTLDTDTINKIESKLNFTGSQIPQISTHTAQLAQSTSTPIPTPINTPQASPSATFSPTPKPTP